MVDTPPWLIVGLGNPGPGYAQNRHNVGFMAVSALCESIYPTPSWSERFKGQITTIRIGGARTVLLRPMTFMNRSGDSVQPAAAYYRVPVQQIVVLHDEIDFDFGRVAVKEGGGHGGHNGLRDLIRALGSRDFLRVRIGVGRPVHGEVADYVLANFNSIETGELPDLLSRARGAAEAVLTSGVRTAMNTFNSNHRSTV
ncbi:MAG TPA: aminoacyl-tRNA hydrolase [Nannocystis exedens]|nr:aminoacyl-tRNA hydrolase [Nannocystis exedens]